MVVVSASSLGGWATCSSNVWLYLSAAARMSPVPDGVDGEPLAMTKATDLLAAHVSGAGPSRVAREGMRPQLEGW
jgi:hypothetical protein